MRKTNKIDKRSGFSGIQSKLVIIFLLIVLVVTTLMGTFLSISMSNFYDQQFSTAMSRVFTDDFIRQAERDMQLSQNPAQNLYERLSAYIPQLGIDSYCNFFIVDSQTGNVVKASDMTKTYQVQNTAIMLQALSGKRGGTATADSMEYAVPIDNYIVYIFDSKEQTKSVMSEVLKIIMQAIVVGIGISIILGFFLSRTITKPISTLTKRARSVASGDFSKNTESIISNDEIGELSRTFEHMSSQLKNTMNGLESEKTKMQTILKNMGEGVIAFDDAGFIIHVNPAAKHMLGICNEETIEFDEFMHDIGIDVNLGELLYLEEKKTLRKKLHFNGQYLSIYFARIEIDYHKKHGVVVGISDITESEQLDISRREFVANVSHELRTPLTTIKAYTETVLNSHFEDAALCTNFLGVVVDEVDRMTRIVQDLLLLSQLDHGNMACKMGDVKFSNLIRRVSYKMEITAKEKNQVVKLVPQTELPNIQGDSDKIEQVLTNIISNASKYTPEGGHITIYAGAFRGNVYVKVVDDGIGISKEDQKRIFERFYRVDKARTRAAGGTGLGLAIAAQIVELHGGSIKINSDTGMGTEVVITLPIQHSSHAVDHSIEESTPALSEE